MRAANEIFERLPTLRGPPVMLARMDERTRWAV